MTKDNYGSRGSQERKEIIRAGIFSFVVVILTVVAIGLVGVWNAPEEAKSTATVAAGFPGAGSPFPAAPIASTTTTTTTTTSSSSVASSSSSDAGSTTTTTSSSSAG